AAPTLGPVVERMLAEHSVSIATVAAAVDERFARHELEALVAAFFARFPFLEFRRNGFLAAPHPYVRLFAATGPVFRALELAREAAARRGATRPASNPEAQRMGRRFEELTGWLLSKTASEDDLIREHVYDDQEQRSPDFLLFERPGFVTLVQAKLKRLSPGAFFGFDYDAFRRDAEGAIAESIWRSIRYLRRIHDPRARLSRRGEEVAARI